VDADDGDIGDAFQAGAYSASASSWWGFSVDMVVR
jgi:hypothetical protein